MGRMWKQWHILFSWAPKSLLMMTAAMKLEGNCSLEENGDKPRQHIKKQKHHFADKGPYGQSYVFSNNHVWMWELDHKECWAPKKNMLLNYGAGEHSCESCGLQGDPTSQSQRKSILNIYWKDWCESWRSNTLATWYEELTHWKRSWSWERLKGKWRGRQRIRWLDCHHQLNGYELE